MDSREMTEKYLTKDSLENIFSNYFKKTLTLNSFSFDDNVGGGGYLSNIVRLKLNWNTAENILPSTLIVKLWSSKINSNDEITNCFRECANTIHANECSFYVNIAPLLPIPIPKCFFAKWDFDGSGVIIMEDLFPFQDANIIDGFNVDQLYEIARNLAKLHAWSLNTTVNFKEHFIPLKDPKKFFELLKTLAKTSLTKLKEKYPSYFQNIQENCIEIAFNKYDEATFDKIIITHQDFWIHNILFKNDDSKIIGGIIDWQFVTSGSFLDDFSRLMTFSVKPAVRKEYEEKILTFYYDTLKNLITTNYALPSLENILESYRKRFACDAFVALADFSILLEECLQMQGSQGGKEYYHEEILKRGAASLEDAQNILHTL